MIIRELRLHNFGIYGGDYQFDLVPKGQRPIVLFRGKNGVGKSTLMEALHLAVHGPLVLGPRVGKAEFLDYLSERIHRPAERGVEVSEAGVTLVLDFFHLGRKTTYRIERKWSRKGRAISVALDIFENDVQTKQAGGKEGGNERLEAFLREIVPPSTTDLLFFDGERLQALADDTSSRRVLSELFKTVTGLGMVEMLQRDLEFYTLRNMDEAKAVKLRQSLEEARLKLDQQRRIRDEVSANHATNAQQLAKIQEQIALCEQDIAQEGQWFADRRDTYKDRRTRLRVGVENYRRRVQEVCQGVLPFAIAASMCKQVATRLRAEEEWEKWTASSQILDRQLVKLEVQFANGDFWTDLGWTPSSEQQEKLLHRVESALKEPGNNPIKAEDVILQVSDQERNNLLIWIEQLLPEAANEFRDNVRRLERAQRALSFAEAWLKKAPEESVMKPLYERLVALKSDLLGFEQKKKALDEELRLAEYWCAEYERQIKRLGEDVGLDGKGNEKVAMANNVRRVLTSYGNSLTENKLDFLERQIVQRFNSVCRKDNLLEGAHIDPRTFAVTLMRTGEPFGRERLSAGEKQLLATAIMWAMRDVSGLPIPLIIDTPMGRLDSDHRRLMLENYLPHASHQVLVLATDMEIDESLMRNAGSHLSHIYTLAYNDALGRTSAAIQDEYGGAGSSTSNVLGNEGRLAIR